MGAGDANVGAGYGSLKSSQLGADSQAELSWPYVVFTSREKEADSSPDETRDEKAAIRKKKMKRSQPADNIDQLNYRPHSFVNGSTRGLAGIMSGMDPKAVLEQFINEIKPVRKKFGGGVFGQKPLGMGAPQPDVMNPDATTRIRPGKTLGSKQGWFSPHPPKDSDPEMSDNKYSLEDIAHAEERKPIRLKNIEIDRVKRKSYMNEEKIALLRSYLRIVFRSS